jgi:hypothetical protein
VESSFKSSHIMRLKATAEPWKWKNKQSCQDIMRTYGIIKKQLPTFSLW